VLPHAIARIAAHAALAGDGVIGLTHASASAEASLLAPRDAHKGVDVQLGAALLDVELFVVLRYGAPLAQLAEATSERVHAALTNALGAIPVNVQVRVQGLRAPVSP